MRGFSRANLYYMRAVAGCWTDVEEFVQQDAGRLPWTSLTTLLDGVASRELRDWYAAQAVVNGWSRPVLLHQIKSRLHIRLGSAPSNLPNTMPGDSDLARQLTKDPLILDFLFFVELLFFHIPSLRYVVLELKIETARPGHLGQLDFYVTVVDEQMRDARIHAPTVGILLCPEKNDVVVEYALRGKPNPLSVNRYTFSELPAEEQSALPSAAALRTALHTPAPDEPRDRSRASASGAARRSSPLHSHGCTYRRTVPPGRHRFPLWGNRYNNRLLEVRGVR
jgi:predicted nuclease of restriction endonuclease-like (RecB) superfamily